MDAVSTTVDCRAILRNEAAVDKQSVNIADEDCCTKCCPKSYRRCLLRKGHDNRCSFTAKKGCLLSASSLERILSKLTNRPTKSLAGLDDEKVINKKE